MRSFEEIQADLDKAISFSDIESLLRYAAELEEIQTPVAEASAYRGRGAAYAYSGDYSAALEQFHSALNLYVELADHNEVARLTGSIGNVHLFTGDYSAALELLHRALNLFEELGAKLRVAQVTGNIGNVYLDTGNFPAALENYNRALALHEKLGDRIGEAGITGSIGSVYTNTGDYPAALEHFHRAMVLHEELGDRWGVARDVGSIGGVYAETGNHTEALSHLSRALTLNEELGNRKEVASTTGNIGNVYLMMGDNPVALEHYQRALSLHEALGYRPGVARYMCGIVDVYLRMGCDTDAQSLQVTMDAMQFDAPESRIMREINRATLQERSGDLDGTAVSLHRALAEAREHGLRTYAADAHKALRDLAQKRNDLTLYIEHNNEYQRVTEEINGKDTTTKLAMQEAERKMAKERSEHEKHLAVLHSTLPKHIADRVARGETVNDHFDNAAVMFLDIVGFTTLSSTLTSQQVTSLLDVVFEICDEACKNYNVTRIKTIGDSYMAVAFGEMPDAERQVPNQMPDAERQVPNSIIGIANAALQIIAQVKAIDFKPLLSLQFPTISTSDSERLQVPSISTSGFESLHVAVRVGLHCGSVTAGVLGKERLQYDVWGDTVNVASRMESTSEPNRIHVSENFAFALSPLSVKERGLGESSLMLGFRGETEVKGKGTMQTFWLERA